MENKEEPVFADGLMWRDPHPNAPDFVKGSLSIHAEKLYAWAKEHTNEKGWVSVDMKQSKKGGIYYQLNTFKPKNPTKTEDAQKYPEEDNNPDDIPF